MFAKLYQPNTREGFEIFDSIIETQQNLSQEVLGEILSRLSLVTVENIGLVSSILEKYRLYLQS